MKSLFSRRLLVNLTGLGIILGALFIIFPPEMLLFRRWAAYAGQIMIAYVALGLLFLLFRHDRLTFVSFFSAAILALFIKTSSNQTIRLEAPNASREFQIAQLDLGGLNDPFAQLAILKDSMADLMILQSIDPLLILDLKDSLGTSYPYYFGADHPDQGLWVFSRWPLGITHISGEQEQPQLAGILMVPEASDTLEFVATFMYPMFAQTDLILRKDQLKLTSDLVGERSYPILAIGQFNEVSWAPEIREFREKTGLLDSRRGYLPGLKDFLDKPTDHIFYSSELACIAFRNEIDSTGRFLGISGTYQFK